MNFDHGFYYFSNETSQADSNLVFVSEFKISNEDYVLVSIYETDHINDIVRTAATVNIYMFIVVLIILIIASFIYSKEFSRPLLYINEKTKRLSILDFTEPPLKLDSTDEFAELANNINILSSNLRNTLNQLNDQNIKLSKSLEYENQLEERRYDFIRGMSHELKTPLAVIQASSEALQNDIYSTDEEIKNALELIQNEVTKTNKMIKNMTQVYTLESTLESKWEYVDMESLIKKVINDMKPLYSTLDIKLSVTSEPVQVYCIKEKIELVITNLFNNAIKYTPSKENINITLIDKGDFALFSIKNSGITIKQNDLEKIFEPFYRVDKVRSRVEGSSGLGLYIVSKALELHDTKCIVTSNNNFVQFEFKLFKK